MGTGTSSLVLHAARAGAEWAWTAIYRELAPPVLGYLRARGAAEPEDLLGEVFLQVVRDIPRFHGGEEEFRSWVFTIAHHRLLDDVRKMSRRPLHHAGDVGTVPEVVGPSGDAEMEALERLGEAAVRKVLDRLSPDQRDVLLMRVFGDLSIPQIADAVGKRQGAVKALLRRGFAAVRRELSADGVSFQPAGTLTE